MRVAGLFLLVGLALADPITDAADQVLAAKDLKQLAAQDKPDPWLVADELCRRGEFDKAEAFAKAAPRKDTEKLPRYIQAQRKRPTTATARKAFAESKVAGGAGDLEAVVAAVDGAGKLANDLTGVKLEYNRAVALREQRRFKECAASTRATA